MDIPTGAILDDLHTALYQEITKLKEGFETACQKHNVLADKYAKLKEENERIKVNLNGCIENTKLIEQVREEQLKATEQERDRLKKALDKCYAECEVGSISCGCCPKNHLKAMEE